MSRRPGSGRPPRLDRDGYARLRSEIFERDGWRCQSCGRGDQLQIHHLIYRSHCGEDCQQNLITLCAECHMAVHT